MSRTTNGVRADSRTIATGFLLAACAAVCLPAPAPAAAPAAALCDAFTNPETKWTSETYKFASPQYVDNELGKGCVFHCDFSLADPKYPRGLWDAKLAEPVDLSKASSIVMDVRLSEDSVKYFCLYLKSNGKWFPSRYVEAMGKGTNLVVFQIADYRMDGTSGPAKSDLLNHVEAVRVNVFPMNGVKSPPTDVTVRGVRVSDTKVDRYASLPLFEPPAADRDLKRPDRRDKEGRLLESRMITDMTSKYLTEGADKTLARLKRAGFNVYVLTAWHGRGAIYRSSTTRVEPRFRKYFQGDADPAAKMIRKAHAKGMQVSGQFLIGYRGAPDPHPEFPVEGSPIEGGYLRAYDLQDPAYRDFIVKEIVDFASKYDVDGIQLDYVRTLGIYFSKIAAEQYEKKYGSGATDGKGDKAFLGVFDDPNTKWTSETYKFASPKYVTVDGGRACAFDCDFSLGDPAYPRCLWDAKLAQPVVLSKAGALAMDVRATNPASVKYICIFLKSNGQWYLSKYVGEMKKGTNHLVFDVGDYRLSGTRTPARLGSLNHVEAVRVNVFPKDGLKTPPTKVTISNVRVIRRKIDELKPPRSPEIEKRLLEWQEQAVSDIVRRVSEGVRKVKPDIVISVCGHPHIKPQLDPQGRNEWIWVEKGWVDVAYEMAYGWRPDFAALERIARSTSCPERFAVMLGDRDQEGGKAFPRNPKQFVRLMDYAQRKFPACGIAVWDYVFLSDEQIEALRSGPFKEPAVPHWPTRSDDRGAAGEETP